MSLPPNPTRNETPADDPEDGSTTLPVLEEELDVDVRERVTGRVRVTTRTETVERHVEEALWSVTANVTRVPVERELEPGEPPPETRIEEGVTIVPVLEERLVVEKRLVLVEEVRIERLSESEEVSVPVSVRRQRVDVERLSEDSSEPPVSDPPTETES